MCCVFLVGFMADSLNAVLAGTRAETRPVRNTAEPVPRTDNERDRDHWGRNDTKRGRHSCPPSSWSEESSRAGGGDTGNALSPATRKSALKLGELTLRQELTCKETEDDPRNGDPRPTDHYHNPQGGNTVRFSLRSGKRLREACHHSQGIQDRERGLGTRNHHFKKNADPMKTENLIRVNYRLPDRTNQVIGWTLETVTQIQIFDRNGRLLGHYSSNPTPPTRPMDILAVEINCFDC